ncbi:DDE-type integrase/transposase/recombinase [Paracidovorax cattleyae]|uniref:DDE-type integrase/transposase/recombinase n=1 Tax=Paracidovorax cattleyae TaxID=80868 RepID=UPI0018AFC8C8|nr:DDE-type integrase/transposase/recombinase [Paracidovorax cattleyae]MBF9263338.1 DDE-type integrase/transposase/recombinase [Paracidovorax cattleyae]
MKFEPHPAVARQVPHALKAPIGPDEPQRYLRLTHQFAGTFFGMWVTDEAGARYARRPVAFTLDDLADLEKKGGIWGRLALPYDLLPQLAEGEPDPTDGAWRIIAPLVESFKSEKNLGRTMFTHLVHLRASETESHPRTVLRLVNRYYYFGQVRPALGRLQPGPAPGRRTVTARPQLEDMPHGNPEATSDVAEVGPRLPKRRGRKSSLEASLGPNTFVASDADITDMVKRLASMARKRRTFVSDAYEEYLKTDFKARHPAIFELYAQGKHPAPVSLRQYRGYTNENLQFERDVARNLRTRRSGVNYNGSLDAIGPGDVYEIDATAGRIVLTTAGSNRRLVAKPTIYLIIDRWSRYIVSIYVSLKAPSWDEARYALLIAFTSRTKRFRALGIDTDDQRWPVGRMCVVLRRDRGSELTSESMDRVVAGDLKADPSSLPPITPNGKAIVERF